MQLSCSYLYNKCDNEFLCMVTSLILVSCKMHDVMAVNYHIFQAAIKVTEKFC